MQTSSRYGLTAAMAAGLALVLTACTGSAGPKGADGTNGTSCTAVKTGNTTTVTCGSDSAVITDGTAGTSCTMTTNSDATKTITCGSATVTIAANALVDYNTMTAQQRIDSNLNVVVTGFDATSGKVDFKINDRYGNGVKNLWAIVAPATSPNTSMRFGLLQLVAGVDGSSLDTWVSYNAANATSTGSAETAGTNPASGNPVVDNGDGSYSYTFFRAIAASTVVTYDATKLHKLVMIMSATGNPIAPFDYVRDFKPALGVTDASLNGSEDKVDPSACLECHAQFRASPGATSGTFHGGSRYDPRVCVACHNWQRKFVALNATDAVGKSIGDAQIPASGKWVGNLELVNGEGWVNFPVFIHKIHRGKDLSLNGGPYGGVTPTEITFPQDIRNCDKCHRTPAASTGFIAPRAGNYVNPAKVSRRACGACHDNISFVNPPPVGRVVHPGGPFANDNTCSQCHNDVGVPAPPAAFVPPMALTHVAIALPDQGSAFHVAGGNNNTNAACMTAAAAQPAGADVFKYVIQSVSTFTDAAGTHPQMVFKLTRTTNPGGVTTDVNFGTFVPATPVSLFGPDYVGGPSIYWVFSVPQDGITSPADYNASTSVYLETIWKGTPATPMETTAAKLTGPDAANANFYTMQIKNVNLPAGFGMLQGGVGYTYGLASTQPQTLINLTNVTGLNENVKALCAVAPSPVVAGKLIGGLIVPSQDAQLKYQLTTGTQSVGTGGSGGLTACTAAAPCTCTASAPCFPSGLRRPIVEEARCNKCHEQLGANPSFHAGQRNEATTCNWCHNPNQSTSAWSGNEKDFIHSLHGADKRTVPFTWHAVLNPDKSLFEDYAGVTYPGVLNVCEQCHLPNTYNFSLPSTVAALPTMLSSTVGQGVYAVPAPPPAFNQISPYVNADGVTNYGVGFKTSNITSGTYNGVACSVATPCVCSLAAPCNPEGTTLMKSPIVSACSACHDTTTAISHMRSNGGAFYEPRSAKLGTVEQCLICHGPGTIADVDVVHAD